MSLWGKIDQANNAPKYKINPNSPNTGIELFGTEVVGLDDGEVANGNVAGPGWVRVQRGTGYVTALEISAAGTGYSNNDIVRVSGGTTNAAGTVTTNGAGAIQSVTLTNGGAGFANVSSATIAVANTTGGTANGTGATITFTLGGRAGRVQTEVLVALTSMTANGSSL